MLPVYFKCRISRRHGEDMVHLNHMLLSISRVDLPWGWFGISRDPDPNYFMIRGVAIDPILFTNLGKFCTVTGREIEFIYDHGLVFPQAIRKFADYLQIYPMGNTLLPLGSTVIAVPVFPNNKRSVIQSALSEYLKGKKIYCRVIACGPLVKKIKEGDTVYYPNREGVLLETDLGIVSALPEREIELIRNKKPSKK